MHTLRGVSTCAHTPWCVDLCTHSVLCRLVKCHAATEHIFNNATVHVKTGVCVSVSVLTEQLTTDLCLCVSPHRAVHNRSVSVCQSSPSSSQQICVCVSVLTEQFTTDLYQCFSPHRAVHNRSVSVCQSSPSSSQQICISVSVLTEQFTTDLYQ